MHLNDFVSYFLYKYVNYIFVVSNANFIIFKFLTQYASDQSCSS